MQHGPIQIILAKLLLLALGPWTAGQNLGKNDLFGEEEFDEICTISDGGAVTI